MAEKLLDFHTMLFIPATNFSFSCNWSTASSAIVGGFELSPEHEIRTGPPAAPKKYNNNALCFIISLLASSTNTKSKPKLLEYDVSMISPMKMNKYAVADTYRNIKSSSIFLFFREK